MRRERNEWLVGWTPTSKADLLDIGTYLSETASTTTAEAVLASVYLVGEQLIQNPRLWRVRTELKVVSEVRFAPLQSYFICYRIAGSVVEILRVVHQRRDIAALFIEMGEHL